MTRRLRIEWEPGSKVTGLLSGPGEGPVGILLAHGAGAGQRHPFMAGLRARLADTGLGTMTFDYPYVEAGRRAPDRLPRLLACHEAALGRISDRFDRVVVAGKSMGGRVGGHLVAGGAGADRLVFLGYPLVPMGKTEARDTGHLGGIDVPMLFIQGERDRLAPLESIEPVVERLGAELEIIPEGDHSYRVPKRTGLDPEDVLDLVAARIGRFVAP
jgi:predicted alpha/beta-hydrolase family hydrolase